MVPCNLVGSSYTETSLWTNESPTSTFLNQTITLPDSIDNYKYLKIKYRASTTNSTEAEVIILVEKFKTVDTNTIMYGVTNQNAYRRLYYVSTTSLNFTGCVVVSGTSASTTNTTIIPLEILGLNDLEKDETPYEETILWTNPSPTTSSGFANQNVILSEDIDSYQYLMFYYAYAFNQTTPDSNITKVLIPVREFKNKDAGASEGFSVMLNVTHRSNDNLYSRPIVYVDNTTCNIKDCNQVQLGQEVTLHNIFAIPLKITGINGVGNHLDTKSITANGTYNAIDDNLNGYSSVTVAVPLGTKSISANGTYNASSDSKAGYSQVTVNVQDTFKRVTVGTISGTQTATQTWNIKTLYPKLWDKVTVANFSFTYSLNNFTSTAYTYATSGSSIKNTGTVMRTPALSYNTSTGVLSLTAFDYSVSMSNNGTDVANNHIYAKGITVYMSYLNSWNI